MIVRSILQAELMSGHSLMYNVKSESMAKNDRINYQLGPSLWIFMDAWLAKVSLR